MKTTMFIFGLFCSIQLMAQISGPCPCGYALTIEASKFNFHKPRTDCTSGFGLCLRIRGMRLDCYPCYSKGNKPALVMGDMVRGYVHFEGERSDLVLPASLLYESGFADSDSRVFSLEDGSIVFEKENGEGELSVIGGDYPFEIRDDLLVIPVQFRR